MRITTNHRFIATLLAAGAFAMSAATVSLAQDALGSGRELDANLGQGTGGFNPAAPQPDFRARNLLVTGNVGAGRGFRQSVGYQAPFEFRGQTGSDRFFNFRAETVQSTLPFIQFGRSVNPLVVGQEFGLLEVRRSTTGSSLANVTPRRGFEFGEFLDAQTRLDQIVLSQQAGAGIREAELQPLTLSYTRDEEGNPIRITASAIRGLQATPLQQDLTVLGLTPYDQARVYEDMLQNRELARPGAEFEDPLGRITPATADEAGEDPDALAFDERIGISEEETLAGAEPDDARLMVDLSPEALARDETSTEDEQALAGDMDRLRDWMTGRWPEDELDEEETGEDERPGGFPDQREVTPPAQDYTGPEDDEGQPDRPTARDIVRARGAELPDDLNVAVLRHGRAMERLAPEGESRLAELLRRAEGALEKGQYFLAEQYFVRALRYQPNNPMAMAGIVNAEIGAGVQASAAMSLRRLFLRHPQMIDVRFRGGILPTKARLDSVVATIRNRFEEERGAANSAMLLAYIGHQLDDRAMIREGIELMEESNPDDPMIPLLRAIWLEKGPAPDANGGDGATPTEDDGATEEAGDAQK